MKGQQRQKNEEGQLCCDDKLKSQLEGWQLRFMKWSQVATEEQVSDRSLPYWEPELSMNCTRSKDTTSHIQNSTFQLHP